MEKNNKQQTKDFRCAEDKALEVFANLLIEKIQSMKSDWKKPWFSPQVTQMPKNLNGRQYNGMNSVILMLMQEKNSWETSRYATFDRITGLNYQNGKDGRKPVADKDGNLLPRVCVNKGEKSTPVMLTTFTCIDKDSKEKIRYDDYRNLTEEERARYNVYPKLQVYNVFNISQTNLKEARPEMYQAFLDEADGKKLSSSAGMVDFAPIDIMIAKDLWVCPIKPQSGDNAYYSITKDEIVIPEKAQFIDGESFYSNLFHEMSHSTGSDQRLNRLKVGEGFGSASYSREELVAEITAALVSTQYGMEKHVKEDSAAYIKSWLEQLHESPDFIKSTLMDVKRSAQFISQRIDAVSMRLEKGGVNADFSDIRQQNKENSIAFSNTRGAVPSNENREQKPQDEQIKEDRNEEVAARETIQNHRHR